MQEGGTGTKGVMSSNHPVITLLMTLLIDDDDEPRDTADWYFEYQ